MIVKYDWDETVSSLQTVIRTMTHTQRYRQSRTLLVDCRVFYFDHSLSGLELELELTKYYHLINLPVITQHWSNIVLSLALSNNRREEFFTREVEVRAFIQSLIISGKKIKFSALILSQGPEN